jgi:hypothetical protein
MMKIVAQTFRLADLQWAENKRCAFKDINLMGYLFVKGNNDQSG